MPIKAWVLLIEARSVWKGVVFYSINRNLFVDWAEVLAGPEVCALGVGGSKGRPCRRAEELGAFEVVHVDGDAKDACQGDEIRADVAVAHHTMVGAPVVHHRIRVVERTVTGEAGNKPCCWPSRVRAFFQNAVGFFGKFHRLALGDLQGGAESLNEIEAIDGGGHSAACGKACAPTASGEILGD